MSAAEKLRALEPIDFEPTEYMRPNHNEWATSLLVSALPQIVAVVEAAEAAMQTETVSALDEDDYTIWYDQPADRAPLDRALAALDEQLGDLGSATEPEAPTPE